MPFRLPNADDIGQPEPEPEDDEGEDEAPPPWPLHPYGPAIMRPYGYLVR